MTPHRPPLWTILLGYPLAVLLAGIGWALAARVETAVGLVGAALLFVLAAVLLVADTALLMKPSPPGDVQSVVYDGEPARYFARATTPRDRAGIVVSVLLGGWLVALAVVGAATAHWLWSLALVPAAFLLGVPVLAVLGRYAAGGVWLTRTRIVDEHRGLRTQLARADVSTAFDALGEVEVRAVDGAQIRQERLAPRPWSRKPLEDTFRVAATDIAGGAARLAEEIRAVR